MSSLNGDLLRQTRTQGKSLEFWWTVKMYVSFLNTTIGKRLMWPVCIPRKGFHIAIEKLYSVFLPETLPTVLLQFKTHIDAFIMVKQVPCSQICQRAPSTHSKSKTDKSLMCYLTKRVNTQRNYKNSQKGSKQTSVQLNIISPRAPDMDAQKRGYEDRTNL